MDKVTAAKKKFMYQIRILTMPEIDDALSNLLGTMVSVSFQTMLQASPRLLKGLRQLLTRRRVEVDGNPKSLEEEKEEETPQEVANLQRIPGDLEDLEKVFADIRLSLPDREGGEVMIATPGTKLSFHTLPVGKLKLQIGTHHKDTLVDGGSGPSPIKIGEGVYISSGSESEEERMGMEERDVWGRERGQNLVGEGGEDCKQHEQRYKEDEMRQGTNNGCEKGEEKTESLHNKRSAHYSCERGYTDVGEEYEKRVDIPYNLDPENLTGEFSPVRREEDEDEDEKVQEVIEISSGDETDEISRPREKGRPSRSRSQEGSFRWEDEFGPTPSHWFEQWVSVIRHGWVIKARELMEAGVTATLLDFYNKEELQEIARRKREILASGLGTKGSTERGDERTNDNKRD
ncbi:hypothetical protein CBR_g32708 [Chara braunii]|uniref:Uncharacterized protein n=1 Tax=Chara braunii TaxID=69332 RepID=A0A388LHC4_CHABU|nr:hypothetical protein CBR_g32708 [Chara braunii]|eukprot:GBG81716.1 hypothetical protein CBR_g32708 [Chara braunii]